MGDRQRVGDDLRDFFAEMLRDVKAGRAAVDNDVLARLDQCRAGLSDRLFFRNVVGVADVKNELVRLGLQDAGAPVSAPDGFSLLQFRDVATNRRDRRSYVLRKFLQ